MPTNPLHNRYARCNAMSVFANHPAGLTGFTIKQLVNKEFATG